QTVGYIVMSGRCHVDLYIADGKMAIHPWNAYSNHLLSVAFLDLPVLFATASLRWSHKNNHCRCSILDLHQHPHFLPLRLYRIHCLSNTPAENLSVCQGSPGK